MLSEKRREILSEEAFSGYNRINTHKNCPEYQRVRELGKQCNVICICAIFWILKQVIQRRVILEKTVKMEALFIKHFWRRADLLPDCDRFRVELCKESCIWLIKPFEKRNVGSPEIKKKSLKKAAKKRNKKAIQPQTNPVRSFLLWRRTCSGNSRAWK